MTARHRLTAISPFWGTRALALLLCLVAPVAAAQEFSPGRTPSGAGGSLSDGDPAESELPDGHGGEDFPTTLDEILNADITQLSQMPVVAPSLQVEVSTVARTESTVGRTPSAVFVITNEMIRRSGATSIPEVLRMAPGLQVARLDSSTWVITIRGFANRFANKLLVQIDGRSVYTPTFGGVFWDVQDVLLEDVERIEVIRGPGATIWGVNAVNGVINILTKRASDTVGVYAHAGGGTEERSFAAARIGGRVSEDFHWRVYGKEFERDRQFGINALDDWRKIQAGFRTDYTPTCCDTITIQGDAYDGVTGSFRTQPNPGGGLVPISTDIPIRGLNVLARWNRELSDDSDWTVQFYFDRTERNATILEETRETFDIDFQHRFPLGDRHELIWGGAYRNSRDEFQADGFVLDVNPSSRTLGWVSGFVQDKMTIVDDTVFLWLGTKLDHNDFTGLEVQPNARALWQMTERSVMWGSISRAVRTPTRVENDLTVLRLAPDLTGFGTFFGLTGNTGFESEEVIAYETGYRVQPTRWLSWDVALFWNDYNSVFNASPTPNPLRGAFDNISDADSYGFELAGELQINPCWKFRGAYSFLRFFVRPDATALLVPDPYLGASPHNQVYAQLSADLGNNLEWDVNLRYVDNLARVPSYVTLDTRLSWYAAGGWELTVVGQNLLDSHYLQFRSDAFAGVQATEVQRGVYGMATWRY